MLITKIIKINYNKQYKKYLSKGVMNYDDNTLEFELKYLNLNSKIEVEVKCDICEIKKKTKYFLYIKNIKNNSIYTCNKCCSIKRKKTNLEKYGVEYVLQSKEIQDKSKKTNLEKYGVENISQNEKIKQKIKQTNLEKYGVEHALQSKEIQDKLKKTNLEKYGVEHALQSKEIQDKLKKTNLEKYGVKFASQSNIIKEKSKKTNLEKYDVDNYAKTKECLIKTKNSNLEKYGVEFTFQNNQIKEKIKQTNLEKYGVDNFSKSEESRENFIISNHPNYIKYLNDRISLFKCDLNKDHEFQIYGDNFYSRINSNLPICTICYPINDQKSIKEKILLEYIKTIYSGQIISGYRDGIEIDIFLPELKLGIEFNGLYWHSNKFKESNYHINKQIYFKEKNINLKFIYEDDFDNNFDIIKSQINNWLGLSNKIYARKTKVRQIENVDEYRNFLNNNHIQGFVTCNKAYGLYYNNELVSLMCFDKKEGRLNMKEGEWNLNRFCNLLNYQVIGGASKLLNHFIKQNNPSRIISYADKDWSNGNLYFKLGFTLVNESKPDYKYIVDNVRKSKQNFTKSKLQKLGHDISLTESQIMDNLGINKIYDCGKMKFELIKKLNKTPL